MTGRSRARPSPWMLVLAPALLAGGCIPLPYATPPLRMTVTSGGGHGRAIDQGSGRLEDVGAATVTTFRIGVNPLQLSPEMDKRFDVGAGYVADLESRPAPRPRMGYMQGAYLESTVWPLAVALGQDSVLRLGPRATVDLLFADGGRDAGVGALAGVELELGTYCTSPVDSVSQNQPDADVKRTQIIGVAAGEAAIALSLQGGFRWVGPQRYWLALVGVSGRLPASAGLLLLWLL